MTTTNNNTAINEILSDKDNWENSGKDLFQNILEGIFIEVEEDIAKESKEHSIDNITLDTETNAEINKLLADEDTEDTFSYQDDNSEKVLY